MLVNWGVANMVRLGAEDGYRYDAAIIYSPAAFYASHGSLKTGLSENTIMDFCFTYANTNQAVWCLTRPDHFSTER